MSPRLRRLGWRRVLAALAVAAVLACGGLAGCTDAAAAKARPGTGGALCAVTRHISGLEIRRINALPQNHETFTFPARITATSSRHARAVAQALCALPHMPAGTFSCPADWGITYRLVFSAGDRKLAPVTLDASGCETVSGLGLGRGRGRWIARSPAFWGVLAVAAGITPADQATFVGSMAS
jgi:hypothetical protein